jgi:hypothetical protein
MELFFKIFFSLIALVLVGIGVFTFLDSQHNGINDCIDAPQYCKTYGDLVTEYPQFIVPENLIHQYVDGALEHHNG